MSLLPHKTSVKTKHTFPYYQSNDKLKEIGINNIIQKLNKKFKEIDIKNHTYYYFHEVININDIDLDNILLDEKSYENILVYDVAYKARYGATPLHIIFDKEDGYIRK